MAPVSQKFLEWQRRRATEASAQAPAATNAPAARRAAAGESGEGFGLVPDVVDLDYLADINSGAVRAPVGGFPSSYDLRDHGRLTAVRNQNPWGTCWAHATMASLESGILGREGVVTDFSENNMANLHGWDWGFDDGGNGTLATAYLVRWAGPANEADDPYANPGGSRSLSPVRHVQQVVWIPGKSDSLDNDAIKETVMEHGAIYVDYRHGSSYYNAKTASYYFPYTGLDNYGHAVAIVGWNDNYDKSNFGITPPGNGAYLVRNSWGASWGRSGYYWVLYYDNYFARSTMYSFRNAESVDNYSRIYQYDPLGRVGAFSFSWGANLFTAAGADRIAAVGFYALAPRTSYTLSIYTGCQAGKPVSGACALTQTGTVSEPGFVTVPLNQAVSVASGSRFSVVLKLTTPGYGFPHAIEYAYTGITSGAAASSGQSFYSSSGSSWTDLTSWNSTANFCIKAYAAGASAAPALASISVSGPATVKSGETATYSCSARYSDNSEKAVTPRWSLPSGSAYASINSYGTLSAGETTIGRAIVIRAIYGENGVAKTNDWAVTITAAPPPAPSGLSATRGGETRSVRLSWEAVSVAENYAVYRGTTAATANAQYLGVAEGNKYSDTTAVPGRDYWYFVKARNGSGTGPFSDGANGWRALAVPEATASDGTSEDHVAVSWSPVEGAAAYRVWRAEDFDAEPTAVSGWLSTTEFADATAVPGTVYWYSVSAAADATGLRPSGRGVPDDGFRAVPVVPETLAIDGDASIPAGGTASYSAYVLYSDGHRGASPVSPTWAVSTGAVSRTGVVTAPVVSANTELTLSANTTIEGVHVSGENHIVVTAVVPAAPANLRVVSATAADGIALAWDAVPGASTYTLTRTGGTGGSPVQIGSTIANSFADTTATPGVLYSYAVAAANAAGTGPRSATVNVLIPLAAPTGVSATIDRTDCVRVSWSAVAGATHYRVARADGEDGAKSELGSWTDALSFDDTMVAADAAAFYFVKAATDATGANASAWSDAVQGMRKPERVLVSLSISGPERVPSGGEAVYACTATYSDGTASKVAPAWAATLGAIGADGNFAAPSVVSDATATITASFGGLSADFAVAIVAPVVERTAEITSVTAAQRWPFSGLVDIDYTLATTPAGTKAAVSVSATDEDHNAVLPATTLSGDGADGRPIEAGSHRITWDLAADHPGFHAASVAVSLSAVPAESVTVTFDGNGGTPTFGTLSGYAGSAYGELPDATRPDYTFAGWWTDANGGTRITADSIMSASVTTLYAHWTANGRDKVQLWEGGPYWATTNVGSENPEDFGLYFWWGDTVGYRRVGDAWVASDGSAKNFSFSPGNTPTHGKDIATLQSEGWITADEVLAPSHDAAHVHWGGSWRMPTDDELTALINNCDWTLTNQNGVNGYVVRGLGGYSKARIFLPAAGYGNGTSLGSAGSYGSYWSSVLYSFSGSYLSWNLYFNSVDNGTYYDARYSGFLVRPVISVADVGAAACVVTLDAQGGSGGTASVTATNGVAMPSIAVPTRAGYTFGGYWTVADGTGTQYYTASGVSARICDLTADTTLYACWMENNSVIDRQLYGATFGSAVNTTPGSMNDFAYALNAHVSAYNGLEDGEAFGWGSNEDDCSIIAQDGTQALELATEGGTLTNKLKAATVAALRAAVANGGAYYEADVKFVPSDSLDCGLVGGTDDTQFVLYAYASDGGPTNLVVFHACYDESSRSLRYTNEVFDVSGALDNPDAYAKIRVEMKGNDYGGDGIPQNLISVSVNGMILTSVIAYQDGHWFLTTESLSSGTRRGGPARRGVGHIVMMSAATVISLSDYSSLMFRGSGFIDNIGIGVITEVADNPSTDYATYVVIDLSGGADATNYPVSYRDAPPAGGFNTDEYKTTKLVLRRIPAGTFTMGSPEDELGHSENETQHEVTLTKPFYIGVFEVTQRQWELVMGNNPSSYEGGNRPVACVSYNTIRGSSSGALWPASSDVDASSFMGRLRGKAVVDGLRWDLPTEAMWEYACRAGTTNALNSGKNLTSEHSDANMDEVGRYGYNSGYRGGIQDGKGGYSSNYTMVGSYMPNNWGLYDMHGNVFEWTLDWGQGNLGNSAQTDPVGPYSGVGRVRRGGSWMNDAHKCRSAYRFDYDPSSESDTYGLRLAAFTDW